MVRIFGVNILDNKRVLIGLTYIYGIGINRSKYICKLLNIKYNIKFNMLNDSQLNKLRNEISKFTIEGDLRRELYLNIKRLININSYRGYRHKNCLPVRGQRTRTNSRTCKKKKKNK